MAPVGGLPCARRRPVGKGGDKPPRKRACLPPVKSMPNILATENDAREKPAQSSGSHRIRQKTKLRTRAAGDKKKKKSVGTALLRACVIAEKGGFRPWQTLTRSGPREGETLQRLGGGEMAEV